MPVNAGLATLSNELIDGSVIVYAVALLGFAVDAAFGTHAAPSADAAVAAPVREPALVASGGGSEIGAPMAIGRSNTASVPAGGRLTRRVGQLAMAATALGWLLHLGAILSRGIAVHRLPWGNMYEFTLALSFTAVTAFLVIATRLRARYLGLFVMAAVVLALGLAVTVLYVAAAPLMPALHSPWLAIHVTAAIIASGVFMVGTAATVMFLFADQHAAAVRNFKPTRFSAFARLLPAPEVLDRIAYRSYAFAFPIWTFAVIAGAIWAQYAWGHYWQWDPKETWALITWLVYAGYLHARATAGWRGRRAAYVAMLGFATILFNYFVVNIVITGMHSYAGL